MTGTTAARFYRRCAEIKAIGHKGIQALLKIGLTIRTQGQCAEGGGMLSAPGGAVKAQIAQNSRSGRDPCSDPTKTAAKSKSPRLRL